MPATRRLAAALFLTITSLGLAACGRFFLAVTTLAPGRPGTVMVSLSIRDTPPAGVTVLSAAVTITGAVLQPGNFPLLNAPVRVQIKKLETETLFLGTAGVPATILDGLSVTFASPELTILNNSGFAIGGCANGAVCELKASLSPAAVFVQFVLVLDASAPIGLGLDLDLNRSLQNDLSVKPSLGVATVVALAGTGPLEDVNDFVGQVSSVGASQFTVRNNSSGLSLSAQVDSATQFAGFDRAGLPNNFTGVRVGQIVAVDLRLLAGGALLARKVEFQDSATAEVVEGIVVSAEPANNRFTLVVLDEVPDITGVAPGNRVNVTLQPGSSFGMDADGLTVPFGLSFSGPGDLLAGQEVQVRVRSLSTDSSGISIATDGVRLRMSQFTAKVAARDGNNFTVSSLPGLFSSAGTTEIRVQTSSETELENVFGVAGLNAGDTVSFRGLLFRATPSPALVAKKVRRR